MRSLRVNYTLQTSLCSKKQHMQNRLLFCLFWCKKVVKVLPSLIDQIDMWDGHFRFKKGGKKTRARIKLVAKAQIVIQALQAMYSRADENKKRSFSEPFGRVNLVNQILSNCLCLCSRLRYLLLYLNRKEIRQWFLVIFPRSQHVYPLSSRYACVKYRQSFSQ